MVRDHFCSLPGIRHYHLEGGYLITPQCLEVGGCLHPCSRPVFSHYKTVPPQAAPTAYQEQFSQQPNPTHVTRSPSSHSSSRNNHHPYHNHNTTCTTDRWLAYSQYDPNHRLLHPGAYYSIMPEMPKTTISAKVKWNSTVNYLKLRVAYRP